LEGREGIGLEASTAEDRRGWPIALAVGPSGIASLYIQGVELDKVGYQPQQDHLARTQLPSAALPLPAEQSLQLVETAHP
jgi:hypothetical protein